MIDARGSWTWRIVILLFGLAAIAAMILHDPAMVVLGLIGLTLSATIFALVRGLRYWKGTRHHPRPRGNQHPTLL